MLFLYIIAGDPEDKTLRKVEIDVMIPKKMRDRAKKEKCVQEVTEFEKCCKAASFAMVFKCQDVNKALKACLTDWYRNEEFKQECTTEYLNERSEYRRTGITQKQKAEMLKNQ